MRLMSRLRLLACTTNNSTEPRVGELIRRNREKVEELGCTGFDFPLWKVGTVSQADK
jgi:hypothetical protein